WCASIWRLWLLCQPPLRASGSVAFASPAQRDPLIAVVEEAGDQHQARPDCPFDRGAGLAEAGACDFEIDIAGEIDPAGDQEPALLVLAHAEAIEPRGRPRGVDEIERGLARERGETRRQLRRLERRK